MKNKKLIPYLLFVIMIFSISSCSKDYLNTSPSDQLDEEFLFTDMAGAKIALNGVYRSLYRQYADQEEDGHPAMMINMDFMGEDVVHTASGTSYFRNAYRWIDHTSETSGLNYFAYRLYYTIIAGSNKIMDRLDRVPGSEADRKLIRGECLALRGWSYFQLVQLFGERYIAGRVNSQLGVPIFTSYSEEPRARSTVEEVYTQVNKDLDEAILLLQNSPARANKTHIDVRVAKGFKARVALTTEKWADAAKYATEARAGHTLMSNSDYLSGFNSLKNSEWMWGANQLADQLPAYGSFFAYMSANYNSSHTRTNVKIINSELYAKIKPTDIRKKLWWDGTAEDAVNFPGVINVSLNAPEPSQLRSIYMHRKFMVEDPAVSVGDIPFMRAAEMYLIESEAKAEMAGQGAAASDALAPLMSNRDPSYVKPSTISVEDVRWQRRIELWGEGFRFFDLKRYKIDMTRRNTGAIGTLANWLDIGEDEWKWQFKIPAREIQNNPLIIQNKNLPTK